jgi:hypothetical protein
MTTCPNGHKNPDKQRFCGECGVRIQIGRDPGVGDAAFRLVTVDIELPGKSGVLRRTKTVPVDEAPPVDGRKMGAPSSKSGVPRPSAPAKSSASRLKALLIGGAAVLVLMVGCTIAVIRHNDKDRQNDSSTVTSDSGTALPSYTVTPQPALAPAPTATTPPPPTSTLLSLTMPSGSQLTQGVTSNGDEQDEDWESGADFDQTVSALRPQLPIGDPLQGVPWCKEDFYQPTRMLSWVWGAAPGTPWIDVEVDPEIGNPTHAVVFITLAKGEWRCIR